MNAHALILAGETLMARPDGSLYWPVERVLVVSDLHLGKSERIARRGGSLLPPYETRETLVRLATAIDQTQPACVICLGDSFDDGAAAEGLGEEAQLELARLQAGRDWIWIEGNHDPGPVDLGGQHRQAVQRGMITFRHIATADRAEVSGHYHPKLRLPGQSAARACFLADGARIILPAFGAYTGGLRADAQVLRALMGPEAVAVLTGRQAIAAPYRASLKRR